ncbi:MAG: hypothetical protein Q9219_003478 [cf. Caloplaca sp. 3 TL-2023]
MAKPVVDGVVTVYRNLFHWKDPAPEVDQSHTGIQESRDDSLSLIVYNDEPNQQPSHCTTRYLDDPSQEGQPPQSFVSPSDGRVRPLKVQATPSSSQPARDWLRVKVSSHAHFIFRLASWTTGSGQEPAGRAGRILLWLVALFKAMLLSPIYPFLILGYVNSNSSRSWLQFPLTNRWKPIPQQYPKFLGRCQESPKHASRNSNTLPINTQSAPAQEDTQTGTFDAAKEQKRLYRPRKLFVKMVDSWSVADGDARNAERPYIFISYAANQFSRMTDPSGRLTLTEEASQRLKDRAIAVAEQKGCEAFWIDFLRAPTQPEATDDVHRFCDVVRGSKLVCVLLAEDKDMVNSLAMFGKRLWCLTECLLAPRHEIYVEGGGKSEMIDIMQLPGRAWTKSYTDDSGQVMESKRKMEEFRILAEHFSGLQPLSPIQSFSAALSAMRALEFFPFQKGDIAYALMALLAKRPAMDPTDSEQQALARLCLFNNNDR